MAQRFRLGYPTDPFVSIEAGTEQFIVDEVLTESSMDREIVQSCHKRKIRRLNHHNEAGGTYFYG